MDTFPRINNVNFSTLFFSFFWILQSCKSILNFSLVLFVFGAVVAQAV
jgi:hypothetical protein